MTQLDEKALEAAEKAFMVKLNDEGEDPVIADGALEAGISAYLEAMQAGEREPFGWWRGNIDSAENGILLRHPTPYERNVLTPLYTAPPSFATVQADNERLREALELAVSRGCNHCAEPIKQARIVAGVYPQTTLTGALK